MVQALTEEQAARQEEAKAKHAAMRQEDAATRVWEETPWRWRDSDGQEGAPEEERVLEQALKYKRFSLHLKEYQGQPYFELRKWWRKKGTQSWFPFKGRTQVVTFSPEQARELLEALAVAATMADEMEEA